MSLEEQVEGWRAAWAEAAGGGSPDVTDLLTDLSGQHEWFVLDVWSFLAPPGTPHDEAHWYFVALGDIALAAWQYDVSQGSKYDRRHRRAP